MRKSYATTTPQTAPLTADQSAFGGLFLAIFANVIALCALGWAIFTYKYPPKGSQGPQGIQGIQGIPGKDGEPSLATTTAALAVVISGLAAGNTSLELRLQADAAQRRENGMFSVISAHIAPISAPLRSAPLRWSHDTFYILGEGSPTTSFTVLSPCKRHD
jgi:hypothetical protein